MSELWETTQDMISQAGYDNGDCVATRSVASDLRDIGWRLGRLTVSTIARRDARWQGCRPCGHSMWARTGTRAARHVFL